MNAKGICGIGQGADNNLDKIVSYVGSLTITGGQVYATGDYQAFGGPNVASLMSLYDGAMVRFGETAESTTLSSAANRQQACVDNDYAAIEPCTHSGAAFVIDNGHTHHSNCGYCMVGAAGDHASGINHFSLNFGEATGIEECTTLSRRHADSTGWHTLDGRKLIGAPTAKGIYINNGKKVIVK